MPLFGERLAVPQWHDLTETTRVEMVGLLAQLLLSVQQSNPTSAPQNRGERDE
jgi:hypothetical protein